MIFIGLGGAGNKIAISLAKSTDSTHIGIDNKNSDIILPVCKSMEEYEEKTLSDYSILSSMKNEEIYFCLAGSGFIAGAALKLLEQIKNNKVTVIFINGDETEFSKEQKLRNKVTKRILQEMVRSGMLSAIYLFNNKDVAEVADYNVLNYFEVINKVVVDTFLSIQYIYESDAIRENLSQPIEACRIILIGIGNLEDEAKMLHPSEMPRYIHQLYELTEKTLMKKETLGLIVTAANKDERNSYKIIKGDVDRKLEVHYTNIVQE